MTKPVHLMTLSEIENLIAVYRPTFPLDTITLIEETVFQISVQLSLNRNDNHDCGFCQEKRETKPKRQPKPKIKDSPITFSLD